MMEGQKVDTATGVDGWDVMRCGEAEGGGPTGRRERPMLNR